MFCLSSAPFAELLEFDFALDKFAVFAGPVIDASAFGASEFYELIL